MNCLQKSELFFCYNISCVLAVLVKFCIILPVYSLKKYSNGTKGQRKKHLIVHKHVQFMANCRLCFNVNGHNSNDNEHTV